MWDWMWTVAADNPPFFNSLGTSTEKSGEKNQHGSSGSQTPHRAQEGRGTN